MKLKDWMGQFLKNEQAVLIIDKSEDRIKRAYAEMLSGYNQDPSKILNDVVRVKDYDGLVMVTQIQFTSICGHHFLPFYGTIDIAYEPGEIITGIGKLPRLVQAYAKRFQIQELLIKKIADEITKTIGAKGVSIRSKATHMCMHSRGPSDRSAQTVCVYATGSLKGKTIWQE